MKKCVYCAQKFSPSFHTNTVCSDLCRKGILKTKRSMVSLAKRGFVGYSPKDCVICQAQFKAVTSRQLTCSSICSLKKQRQVKNKYSKKYHSTNKSNPNYVMQRILRTCLRNMKKGDQVRSHYLCDFSVDDFTKHIESNFKKGMSWENWGDWHIDHIRPLSSFQFYKDGKLLVENVKIANSLGNLQPLWAKENLSKSARLL